MKRGGGRKQPRISAVILAAGRSTRFPGTKQLAELGGRTLIERAVETVAQAGITDIVVVLGHRAEAVAGPIRGIQGVRVLANKDYASGMASSIRTGIKGIERESEGVMLVLADQPLVTSTLLRRMVRVFQEKRPRKAIVAAAKGDFVAPPVIFSNDFYRELSRLRGDRGARSVIQRHQDELSAVGVRSKTTLADIDTPEDLALARKSLI